MCRAYEMFPPGYRVVGAAVFFPVSHEFDDFGDVARKHGQAAKNEKDHEKTAQSGLGADVTVTNGRHGHHEEVDALPVGQIFGIRKIGPGVARIFH